MSAANLLDDPALTMDPHGAFSVPDFDDWGPDSFWHAYDWITWHQAMVQQFGLDEANATFRYYWAQQSAGASPLVQTYVNDDVVAYFRANRLGDLLSDMARGVYSVLSIPDTVSRGASATLDALNQSSRAAQALTWLVPIGITVWFFGTYLAKPTQATRAAFR